MWLTYWTTRSMLMHHYFNLGLSYFPFFKVLLICLPANWNHAFSGVEVEYGINSLCMIYKWYWMCRLRQRMFIPCILKLSWYWMMKYSWLCCSLRRSFSVSCVITRSSSNVWLICWYLWGVPSTGPDPGLLACLPQTNKISLDQNPIMTSSV